MSFLKALFHNLKKFIGFHVIRRKVKQLLLLISYFCKHFISQFFFAELLVVISLIWIESQFIRTFQYFRDTVFHINFTHSFYINWDRNRSIENIFTEWKLNHFCFLKVPIVRGEMDFFDELIDKIFAFCTICLTLNLMVFQLFNLRSNPSPICQVVHQLLLLI